MYEHHGHAGTPRGQKGIAYPGTGVTGGVKQLGVVGENQT